MHLVLDSTFVQGQGGNRQATADESCRTAPLPAHDGLRLCPNDDNVFTESMHRQAHDMRAWSSMHTLGRLLVTRATGRQRRGRP